MRVKKMILLVLCAEMLHAMGYAQEDRKVWLSFMDKVARPVVSALAEDRLKETMPVVLSKHIDNKETRSKVTYLEAWGRVLSGIGPWLNGQGGQPLVDASFFAMIETFFCRYGLEYDPVRIEYAVREFSQHWYLGDGTFSDGMNFHEDYWKLSVDGA
jgi:hypothetical protein